MGTAPAHTQDNQGHSDKQINLGVVQPGERPAIFMDALRRLTNQAKFMHSDLGRHWYSISASLNRVAFADRREAQIEEALILVEIDKALSTYINGIADVDILMPYKFLPADSSDVPDEAGGVRAVVLGVSHPHAGRDGSDAMVEAEYSDTAWEYLGCIGTCWCFWHLKTNNSTISKTLCEKRTGLGRDCCRRTD